MKRFLLWVLGGLVLGGIIHIVTVLGVPAFADRKAFDRIGTFAVDGKFALLPRVTTGVQPLPMLDPAMAHAVCRFSLDAGPVRIRATMPDLYWSVALFNRRGVNAYSLSDRGGEQRPIDIVLATPEQIALIRENPPEDFENIIVIDWNTRDGFAIIRALVTDAGTEPLINSALDAATCSTAQIGG